MRLEDLGIIGNCQFSALVERTGAVAWCCLPRLRLGADLLDAARRDRRRALRRRSRGRRGWPSELSREHERPLDRLPDRRGLVPRPRLRAALQPGRGPSFTRPSSICVIEPLSGQPVVRVRFEPASAGRRRLRPPCRGRGTSASTAFATPRLARHGRALADVTEQRPFALTERKPPRAHLGRARRGGAARALRSPARLDAPLLATPG